MLIVITIAGAAALTVVAYARLRKRSPEAAAGGLRAVRELAGILLVCVRAVEGIVEVLMGADRLQAAPATSWRHDGPYERDYDYEDEP